MMTALLDPASGGAATPVQRSSRATLARMVGLRVAVRSAPLCPACQLTAIRDPALPDMLAVALPGVTYAHRQISPGCDEHVFIDSATDDAVRAVVTLDQATGQTTIAIGETGRGVLWYRLVVAFTPRGMVRQRARDEWAA